MVTAVETIAIQHALDRAGLIGAIGWTWHEGEPSVLPKRPDVSQSDYDAAAAIVADPSHRRPRRQRRLADILADVDGLSGAQRQILLTAVFEAVEHGNQPETRSAALMAWTSTDPAQQAKYAAFIIRQEPAFARRAGVEIDGDEAG